MTPKTVRTPHDRFFRAAMSDIRVARDFLATYLSPAVYQQLDLNSLQLMPTSYVDKALKMVLSDVVYKAKLKDGTMAYIHILCEHQSTCDPLMPFRVWQYVINIWADHIKQDKSQSNKLPLVVPLVFYSGSSPYSGATDIRDLIHAPQPLIEEVLFKQTFQLIDVNQLSEDELQQQQWAGMMALIMKHIRDRDIVLFLKRILGSLKRLEQIEGTDFVILLLNYCLNIGETLNIQEFVATVRQGLSQETGEKVMTIAEQLKAEGKLEAIKKIIAKGFEKNMTLKEIHDLTGLSFKELEKLSQEIMH
jgi:predicted transposase/invertase (TIGR01784 family)